MTHYYMCPKCGIVQKTGIKVSETYHPCPNNRRQSTGFDYLGADEIGAAEVKARKAARG